MPLSAFVKGRIKVVGFVASLVMLSLPLGGCSGPGDKPSPQFLEEANRAREGETPAAPQSTDPNVSRVLLVINQASAESADVGAYYRSKRGIPSANVVTINVSRTDNISEDEYRYGILEPVRKAIRASKTRIDFIVLTKGTPIRIGNDGGPSVDAYLAAMNLDIQGIKEINEQEIRKSVNPYFRKSEPFNSAKFNMYLVTRLDGYSVGDAKRLVDNSLAAKPAKGPFFFDYASNRKSGGYQQMEQMMTSAARVLKDRDFEVETEETGAFLAPSKPLMGYVSWGSNDDGFKPEIYRSIKFLPGSVGETFVSTSGRTFNQSRDGGQSLVADLIANGMTGVKGYVSEPFTFALAQPDILFDRYTAGYNLAESFYMASLVVKWKDIVIGDPLCNPYRKP